MNCQSCRQQLEPFIDDELSVNENVAVLEHVTSCGACQDVFNTEKRIREVLRDRLSKETCPPEVASRAFAAIRKEQLGSSVRRWFMIAVPVAAALVVAFMIPVLKGRNGNESPGHPPTTVAAVERKGFAVERTHDHVMHGALLEWAGLHYDELTEDLAPNEILTASVLKRSEPRARALASPEEFEKVVKLKLGRSYSLPPGFVEGGRMVGGEVLEWHEGLIPQVIVEYGDRELSLYEISGCQAKKLGSEITQLVASMHPVESDPGRQVSISACKGCDAVLVLRNNRTYLLISRHGRDWDDEWLLNRARRLLD